VTEPAITLVDPAIPHPAPVERGLIDRVSFSWKDGQAVAAAIAERLPVALDLIRAGVIAFLPFVDQGLAGLSPDLLPSGGLGRVHSGLQGGHP
jgi:hypothetical protein